MAAAYRLARDAHDLVAGAFRASAYTMTPAPIRITARVVGRLVDVVQLIQVPMMVVASYILNPQFNTSVNQTSGPTVNAVERQPVQYLSSADWWACKPSSAFLRAEHAATGRSTKQNEITLMRWYESAIVLCARPSE